MDDPLANSSLWKNAEERYQPGQKVQGTITRVAQFGVFVQVEPGMEGIIYTFELGQGPSALTGIAPGQELQLYVKSIDPGKKRLELSLEENPIPGLLREHPISLQTRKIKAQEEISWPAPFPLPAETLEQGCPGCQKEIRAGWKYCIYCGHTLRSYCRSCGSEQPGLPGGCYCCECGKLLQ